MNQIKESIDNNQNYFRWLPRVLGIVFLSFFVLGELFPNYWWATHASHFLSHTAKYSIFIAALLLLAGSFSASLTEAIAQKLSSLNRPRFPVWIWLIALGMCFLFFQFPMVEDFYGEAYKLNRFLLNTAPSIPEGTNEPLFSFGLAPWDGQNTIFALITYLVYFLGVTYREGFIYFDAFFGFCFVLTWLYFVRQHITAPVWSVILTLTVLFAPFLLNFYGHIEINSIVLWINLLWLCLAVQYTQNKKTRFVWGLFILLFFCLKLHAVAILYLPVWGLICFSHYRRIKQPSFALSWKTIRTYVLLPIFFVGAIFYFFVFKDYNDPRNLDYNVQAYDRLFLPLISPDPPLDKYNMLSFNHIFDYFSEMLLWSPIAFFLLLVIIILYKKDIQWQKEELLIPGTALILFGSLFFVSNPLLSMQMDWDLYSFPAPLFLVFLVIVVKQIQHNSLGPKVLLICAALAILSIPAFMVHASRQTLSYKLESLGVRIYHTYYEWSSNTIHNGLGLIWQDRALQIERKNQLLMDLQADALVGNDREYGRLWRKEGMHFFNVEKNYAKAYTYLGNSLLYFPNDNDARATLMQTALILDKDEQAYEISMDLLKAQFPTQRQAYISSIQCALEAAYYEQALELSNAYLEIWPDDNLVSQINTRIKENDQPGYLKDLFQINSQK